MERKQKKQIKLTFCFSRIGGKRKTKMNTIDFINIRGQQSFLENKSNPIEIKIVNNTVKIMIDKYKKTQ